MREWVNDFRNTIETAGAHLRRINEDDSTIAVEEGVWCAKEVLGHLIDSAANNHARFVLGQMNQDLLFPGYDQDRWVDLQKYREAGWLRLVDLWQAYNLHLAHVMSRVPEETLKQPRSKHSLQTIAFKTVPESESTTLEYLMMDYIDHLNHHLNQIFGRFPLSDAG